MKSLILILYLFHPNAIVAKEVALTIDDSPRPARHLYTNDKLSDRFIEVFKKHKVQAVFFSNSSRLSENNGLARLRRYSEAGHFIANHTHSHPRLSQTPPEEYIKEIELADRLLGQFSTFKKWFRYPFLNEGHTLSSRDLVRNYLKQSGYINGYVTVDNYDYVINDYVMRGMDKGLQVHLDRACKMLSDLTLDGLNDQEMAAQKISNDSIIQVLLMHENDIEAYCLEDLILRLTRSGWNIVSPMKAFSQAALAREPDTLWLSQGRINAYVEEKTRKKRKLKWDSMSDLNNELKRRRIVDGVKPHN